MLKRGIESVGKAVNLYQNGRAVFDAHSEYMAAEDDRAQEAFDEMMRAAGRLLGPEVEAFVIFAEHGTELLAGGILYAQKCLAACIKNRRR